MSRTMAGVAVLGLAVLAVAANVPWQVDTVSDDQATLSGTVTQVVDGDTFWLDVVDTSIRVWGLDAPEQDEPGYSAASRALSGLVARRELTCRQRDIDPYGRIVGQCFLPDGRDITAAMVATGTAQEYCRFSGNHYGTC